MWIIGLIGCVWVSTAHHEASIDGDGDGFSVFEDCDDADPLIGGPGAWFVDADGDGFGAEAVQGCGGPGHARVDGDCDDLRPDVFPGASEVCDPLRTDEDCDGGADDLDPEGAAGRVATFSDGDGDGFGVGSDGGSACHPGSGAALVGGDCDDQAAHINPGAVEVCGGGDEDCDDELDDAGAAGERAWFVDKDGDLVGGGEPRIACAGVEGEVAAGGDCDDGDPLRFPGADERCNGLDDDCNGLADDAVSTWVDADGDGFGDPDLANAGCAEGHVTNDDDCNDRVATAFPGAPEVCDDVDHDCDGDVDCDEDADGYADAGLGGSDCDDSEPAVHPGSGCDADGVSCLQLYARGEPAAVEVFTLTNPDGSTWETYCDLTSAFGGGWTLLATNDPYDSRWRNNSVTNETPFGSPSLVDEDFKGLGYAEMPIDEVLFDDGIQYARYIAGGDPAPVLSRLLAVPQPSCDVHWSMVEGNLAHPQLCDTALYIHPVDWDGYACDPYYPYADNATGFAWSRSNNDGCPLDDPVSSSFANPDGVPWSDVVRLWGR